MNRALAPSAMAVEDAHARIRAMARETPLLPHAELAQRSGTAQAWLKCENLQHTGSFKLRGALHKLLQLGADLRSRGVVVASTGNHAKAVAHGLRELGGTGLVFAPTTASPAKLDSVRAQGLEVRLVGADALESEQTARAYAADHGLSYVSPYNDTDVVAGQGTVAIEIDQQRPGLDSIYVAVGGGGLVGGMAAWLKGRARGTEIVGCIPAASPAMLRCVAAGRVVDVECGPTLSDGTAGGVEAGALTVALCRDHVDRWIQVEEDAIAEAMRLVRAGTGMEVEGAAGVAVAALLQDADRARGRSVAAVLCGGNLDAATRAKVFAG
ncbi:MAG TPA: threonine/serine dehydratase [Planctomycetota bacterium]